MQDALLEAVKRLTIELHTIAGDQITGVSINVMGTSSLFDLNKPILQVSPTVSSMKYQTESLSSPVKTDITVIALR